MNRAIRSPCDDFQFEKVVKVPVKKLAEEK